MEFWSEKIYVPNILCCVTWIYHTSLMQDASPENKLRLLMIYACVYPEKFEGDKASKLMQVAAEYYLWKEFS